MENNKSKKRHEFIHHPARSMISYQGGKTKENSRLRVSSVTRAAVYFTSRGKEKEWKSRLLADRLRSLGRVYSFPSSRPINLETFRLVYFSRLHPLNKSARLSGRLEICSCLFPYFFSFFSLCESATVLAYWCVKPRVTMPFTRRCVCEASGLIDSLVLLH